jgi:hypothetical protein
MVPYIARVQKGWFLELGCLQYEAQNFDHPISYSSNMTRTIQLCWNFQKRNSEKKIVGGISASGTKTLITRQLNELTFCRPYKQIPTELSLAGHFNTIVFLRYATGTHLSVSVHIDLCIHGISESRLESGLWKSAASALCRDFHVIIIFQKSKSKFDFSHFLDFPSIFPRCHP